MQDENCGFKKFLQIRNVYTNFVKVKSPEDTLTSSFAIFAEVLSAKECKSQQELTNILGCNKAHTSRTLIKMQNKGLVQIEPKSITLTEKGKKFAQLVKQNKKDFVKLIFEGITEEEKEIFGNVIDKVFENINKLENK